jgi:predicted NUDIX family NTP pyrophosphohydrolase
VGAFVSCRRHDDWSFPKGKLHRGETEAQAALREVEEETGLRCRQGRAVGTAAYRDPKRRPKTVRYWEMTPAAGTLGPANEVDDARWVPLGEVPRLLSMSMTGASWRVGIRPDERSRLPGRHTKYAGCSGVDRVPGRVGSWQQGAVQGGIVPLDDWRCADSFGGGPMASRADPRVDPLL